MSEIKTKSKHNASKISLMLPKALHNRMRSYAIDKDLTTSQLYILALCTFFRDEFNGKSIFNDIEMPIDFDAIWESETI